MSIGLGFSLLPLSLKIFCYEITEDNEIFDNILFDNKYMWATEHMAILFIFHAVFHTHNLGSN